MEKLYANIGRKIKILAFVSFIVDAIGAVIAGLVIIGEDSDSLIWGLLTIFCGPFVAFVGSWLMYGFGQLIETTDENHRELRKISQTMRDFLSSGQQTAGKQTAEKQAAEKQTSATTKTQTAAKEQTSEGNRPIPPMTTSEKFRKVLSTAITQYPSFNEMDNYLYQAKKDLPRKDAELLNQLMNRSQNQVRGAIEEYLRQVAQDPQAAPGRAGADAPQEEQETAKQKMSYSQTLYKSLEFSTDSGIAGYLRQEMNNLEEEDRKSAAALLSLPENQLRKAIKRQLGIN